MDDVVERELFPSLNGSSHWLEGSPRRRGSERILVTQNQGFAHELRGCGGLNCGCGETGFDRKVRSFVEGDEQGFVRREEKLGIHWVRLRNDNEKLLTSGKEESAHLFDWGVESSKRFCRRILSSLD